MNLKQCKKKRVENSAALLQALSTYIDLRDVSCRRPEVAFFVVSSIGTSIYHNNCHDVKNCACPEAHKPSQALLGLLLSST